MNKTQMKLKAQDLIMQHLSSIGYGSDYEEFVKESGDTELAETVMKEQMDRVARLFKYKEAWFS